MDFFDGDSSHAANCAMSSVESLIVINYHETDLSHAMQKYLQELLAGPAASGLGVSTSLVRT